MMDFLKRDPVGIAFLVHSSLGLAMAFGLNLTTLQLTAINMFTAAVLSVLVRQRVDPILFKGANTNE